MSAKQVSQYKKLNLGCGVKSRKGYINVDIAKLPGIDVVHDLNKFPYPFKDNQFEEINAFSIIEHLDDVNKVMKELHRILKPSGVLKIIVPHFSSYSVWLDPTHKRAFTYDTFSYFCSEESNFYKLHGMTHYYNFRFRKIKRKILFPKGLHLWNWIMSPIANAFPYSYEHTGFRSIFPAEDLYVELVK